MEKAVDRLEGMFVKTEKDLDYLSRKLDFQLGNMQQVDQKVNPVKLMKKMENIKAEYANIVKEAQAVQEAQKEFSDYFRSQLLSLTDILKKLNLHTGQAPDEDETTKGVFDQLSNLLGIPPGELSLQANGDDSLSSDRDQGHEAHIDVRPSQSVSAEAIARAESLDSKNSTKKAGEAKSVTNRRKDCDEFCEISDQEFKSVSQLITQRLKREEVNKVYSRLWQHFKTEKNTGKLTPKEMNSMGLRVTGATGEAKLKVLRSLKLCQIGKTGEVTLL